MTNAELHQRALATAPGGVHSPVRAFKSVGGTPVFFRSAVAAEVTDVEGRSYIDLCMSFGPLIAGHAHPHVAAAAHAAIDDGWSYGACEPYSLALAEWILARVPAVQRLRFVSSGTEAVMSALRVARGATGRSTILKFEGCYHGHADGLLVQAGSGLAGRTAASSAGIPPGTLAHTRVVALDDERAFDEAIADVGDDLAAVILEIVPANYGLLPQRNDWLRHVAARCRERGGLLIADEVITGFRSGPAGASPLFELMPDLACFGKVIGGGFPVGAYAGRADLLDRVAPAGPVYQAGTLSANPVGMRAGLATLSLMDAEDGWRVLEDRAQAFTAALQANLTRISSSLHVVRHASIFWIHRGSASPIRTPAAIADDHGAWYARFFHEALNLGVYLPPSGYEVCFLSLAHDEAILERALEVLTEAARRAERP